MKPGFSWSEYPCESPRSWWQSEWEELEHKCSVPHLEGRYLGNSQFMVTWKKTSSMSIEQPQSIPWTVWEITFTVSILTFSTMSMSLSVLRSMIGRNFPTFLGLMNITEKWRGLGDKISLTIFLPSHLGRKFNKKHAPTLLEFEIDKFYSFEMLLTRGGYHY